MRTLNITVTDEEYEALSDSKNGRTWHEALLEEFGVDP